MPNLKQLENWLPVLRWAQVYRRQLFAADGVAALIVTLMLIPQSLAYALLAGLPAETGLYASMAPLVVYALFGSSNTLAVGPAAVTSLMTAAAIGTLTLGNGLSYAEAALWLALISGVMLLIMGVLRMGFVAHFLSHPVVTGFVSASGLLIAASQLKHLLGIPLQGHSLIELLLSAKEAIGHFHPLTATIGVGVLVWLVLARRHLKSWLRRAGCSNLTADLGSKASPVLALLITTSLAWYLNWSASGVKVVGVIPAGLPPFTWPTWHSQSWVMVKDLLVPALLIALVGFVESVSVGQSLAARRRERIHPNGELRALGLSNVAAGLSGGLPVTGGFSRSVVNFDAGARTPAAGLMTAFGLAGAALFLTPALHHLPQATLAATIVVAVMTLVDLSAFRRTWRYSHSDFIAMMLTFVLTLLVGVEAGLSAGVFASVLMLLYRSSRPHIATVGCVPGTEHYRNVLRHTVITHPAILGLRVDESLYFANARYLEDYLAAEIARQPEVRHVVLQCSAVNDIDASALESLEAINDRLSESGVQLHLSEVKGPVMDRLQRSEFVHHLSGRVFLTHHQAVQALSSV